MAMSDEENIQEEIKKLNSMQIAQLILILSIKLVPFFSKEFLKKANKYGYLNTLFISLNACLACSDLLKISNINNIQLGVKKSIFKQMESLTINKLDNTRNRVCHQMIYKSDNARAGNMISDRDKVIAQDIDRVISIFFMISLTRDDVFDRVLALARVLGPNYVIDHECGDEINFLYLFFMRQFDSEILLYSDIEKIKGGKITHICNNVNIYGAQWKVWNDTLKELGAEYWSSWYIRLYENHFMLKDKNEIEQIINLPPEIWGEELAVSSQYLKGIFEQGGIRLNEARIILLGEKEAGKTSLARRLINPKAPMPKKDESTEGVEITGVKLSSIKKSIEKEKDANVNIWDFAGHSVTHAAHRFFLSERCLYIILCDGRSESRHRLGYWLDHVRNYGGDSKVIVLLNLVDNHAPDISENYYKGRYSQHKCEFFRFSIKEDIESLNVFRDRIADIIANSPAWDQTIPVSYYNIKEEIQKEFLKQKNYISREHFNKIADQVPIQNRETLLKGLDCLGTCLWYPEVKNWDMLVLNPRWITSGIYKIINWIKKNKSESALIYLTEFSKVFEKDKTTYNKKAQKFLYELMQQYELAYKRFYHDGIVVPQCLPEDSPKEEDLPIFSEETSLYVEISAFKSGSEQPRISFPPDVLPRFIVRRSEDINSQRIWRYGAVLKRGNVEALIQQEYHLIKLKVKGEEKKAFYDELLITLVDVLQEYKSFVEDQPEIRCALMTLGRTGYEMVPLYQVNNIVQKMINDNVQSLFDDVRRVRYSRENVLQYPVESRSVNMFMNCCFEESLDMREQKNMSKVTVIGDNNKTSTMQINDINSISFIKLKELVKNLKDEIPSDAPEELKQHVGEIAESIEAELKKKKPKKFVLEALVKSLDGLIASVEFGAAVAAIVQFVSQIRV